MKPRRAPLESRDRRRWLQGAGSAAGLCSAGWLAALLRESHAGPDMSAPCDPVRAAEWLRDWRDHIHDVETNRYCDTALGEQVGWLISPFLEAFYYGFRATGEIEWIDRLVDWADAWIRRAVVEPDGKLGWPKIGGASTVIDGLDKLDTDSLLGEAMALRSIAWACTAMRSHPEAAERHGRRAEAYLKLSRDTFDKWDRRGAWRQAGEGEVSIVVPYGIDTATGGWTEGERRKFDLDSGFSHPANKANAVATWLLAMAEATGDGQYRHRAAAWFELMKARLRMKPDDTYEIWNYWEPVGPWDYDGASRPKHWVGIHPNPGYYEIDVRAMVYAHRSGVVFSDDDIARLARTALSTRRMWSALAPFEPEIRKDFESRLDPKHWEGLTLTPWYLTSCSPSLDKAIP